MFKFKKLNLKGTHKNKKFYSISKAILKRSIITLFITVTLTSFISFRYFNNIIIDVSEDKALASLHVIEKELKEDKSSLEKYVKELSTNSTLINSLKTKNTNNLNSYINNLSTSSFNNLIITDATGLVIISNSSTYKQGDNISGINFIKSAFEGKVASEIGRVTTDFYGINSASPIYLNNEVIGVITAAFNIEDVNFLDEIKSVVNSEVTIFENDTRVNTTIIQDGKRLVGTKLDPKIADIVINNKEEYIGKADILGKPYTTVYKPILYSDGSVSGIIFTGDDYSNVENKIINVAILINIISVLSVIVSIIVLEKYFRNNLKNPLNIVVNAAKSIETGEINEDTINQLKLIPNNNEIGLLASSVEGAVESVNLLAENINEYRKAMINHDLTFTTDSSLHSGIYMTIFKIVEILFAELRSVLSEINQAADSIDSGTEHVSSAAQILAQGSTEQASSTEELAATISDISEQIKNDAISAMDASKFSDETGSVIIQSSQYMSDLMNAMDEINHTSKEIEKIIKAIDDIAFQTNILALNAAVEAARAGVAGKGFAVVADEVRNLASKSAEAAKSTTLLIESSTSAVEKGSRIAKDTETVLKNVVDKANKTNLLINEISDASQKQSDSIYQVNIGIDQISSVVQGNSATAEQLAASSEELSGLAHSLKEMVGKYIL